MGFNPPKQSLRKLLSDVVTRRPILPPLIAELHGFLQMSHGQRANSKCCCQGLQTREKKSGDGKCPFICFIKLVNRGTQWRFLSQCA